MGLKQLFLWPGVGPAPRVLLSGVGGRGSSVKGSAQALCWVWGQQRGQAAPRAGRVRDKLCSWPKNPPPLPDPRQSPLAPCSARHKGPSVSLPPPPTKAASVISLLLLPSGFTLELPALVWDSRGGPGRALGCCVGTTTHLPSSAPTPAPSPPKASGQTRAPSGALRGGYSPG